MVKREMEPTTEFKFNMRYVYSTNVLYDQIKDAKSDLDELYSDDLNEMLEAASQTLSKAKRIYILGSRTTFAVAYYCYFSLNRIMENVILIENRNDDISIRLQYVTKDDVLLAITYPKYTGFTLKIVKFFKDQGCKIVGITDRYTSPIAQYANHLLIVKNMLKIYFVTTFTIINALIILVGRYNPQAHIAVFDEENEITRRLGVYGLDTLETEHYTRNI
jgi:DNA-binding MurR/RpiR family transcriptional regulator